MLSTPKEVPTFSSFAFQTCFKLGNPSKTKPRHILQKKVFQDMIAPAAASLSWCYSLFNLPPLSNNNDHNNFAKDLLPTHFTPQKGWCVCVSLSV